MDRKLALYRKPLVPQLPPDRLTTLALFCGMARPDSNCSQRGSMGGEGRELKAKCWLLILSEFTPNWNKTHHNNHFLSKDHFRLDAISIPKQFSPIDYYQQQTFPNFISHISIIQYFWGFESDLINPFGCELLEGTILHSVYEKKQKKTKPHNLFDHFRYCKFYKYLNVGTQTHGLHVCINTNSCTSLIYCKVLCQNTYDFC